MGSMKCEYRLMLKVTKSISAIKITSYELFFSVFSIPDLKQNYNLIQYRPASARILDGKAKFQIVKTVSYEIKSQ